MAGKDQKEAAPYRGQVPGERALTPFEFDPHGEPVNRGKSGWLATYQQGVSKVAVGLREKVSGIKDVQPQ